MKKLITLKAHVRYIRPLHTYKEGIQDALFKENNRDCLLKLSFYDKNLGLLNNVSTDALFEVEFQLETKVCGEDNAYNNYRVIRMKKIGLEI